MANGGRSVIAMYYESEAKDEAAIWYDRRLLLPTITSRTYKE